MCFIIWLDSIWKNPQQTCCALIIYFLLDSPFFSFLSHHSFIQDFFLLMFTCDNNFATNIVKALGLIHRLFTITPSIVATVFCLCENTLKTLNCQKQSQSCREYVFVTRQPELFALIFIFIVSLCVFCGSDADWQLNKKWAHSTHHCWLMTKQNQSQSFIVC